MAKTKPLPSLYSPTAVVFLTFLFTPLFGGHLQAQNWEVLGERGRARGSRLWSRATLWFIGLYLVMQAVFVDEPAMRYSGPYVLLVMWLAGFFTSGLAQVKYVRALGEKDRAWTVRPIGRMIVIGGLCWVLYAMTGVSIGLALSMFDTRPVPALTAPAADNGVVIRKNANGDVVVEPAAAEKPAADGAGKPAPAP